tara:strand:- start:31249 stop:32112 length:864 start_codon:yes stop_codon:yes gene_type:complete
MEKRDTPERSLRDKEPSAFVSESRLRESQRVLSPATQSSINRYDRSDVIERELKGKKAAAIERLAAKGINIARIGPDPAQKGRQEPDQFVWETANTPPAAQDENTGDTNPKGPPSFKWREDDPHNVAEGQNASFDAVTGFVAAHPPDQTQDAIRKGQAGHSEADDLFSRFTQVPQINETASVPNTDLTDMAIEHHGFRLPDKKPGTPQTPKPVASAPAEPLHSGRRRATAESYAVPDSLAAQPQRPNAKPERQGVERWAPHIGAYMIAAIAVGYVLVLTMMELYTLF